MATPTPVSAVSKPTPQAIPAAKLPKGKPPSMASISSVDNFLNNLV